MKLFLLYFAACWRQRLIAGHHAPVLGGIGTDLEGAYGLRAERRGAVDLLYRARAVGAPALAGDDDFVEPLHDKGIRDPRVGRDILIWRRDGRGRSRFSSWYRSGCMASPRRRRLPTWLVWKASGRWRRSGC